MNIKLPIVLLFGWILINISASADQFDPEFEGGIDTTINDISTGVACSIMVLFQEEKVAAKTAASKPTMTPKVIVAFRLLTISAMAGTIMSPIITSLRSGRFRLNMGSIKDVKKEVVARHTRLIEAFASFTEA